MASLLVWLNFKYYAAVLFWFALLGAFGAIAYATLRQLTEPASYLPETAAATTTVQAETETAVATAAASSSQQAPQAVPLGDAEPATADPEQVPASQSQAEQYLRTVAQDLSHLADWLPARLFGVGFALVGHFFESFCHIIKLCRRSDYASRTGAD